MEILNTIIQYIIGLAIVAAITACVILPVWFIGWLFLLPDRRFKEPREFNVRVIKKVPTEETDAMYRNIDLAGGSFASQWGGHPLQLVVSLNNKETPCNCSPSFYETVQVDDMITVVALVDPKTNQTKNFCYVP